MNAQQVTAAIVVPAGDYTDEEKRHQWKRADQEYARALFHRELVGIGPAGHSSRVDDQTGEVHLTVTGWAREAP
ncbi:hypothetical protein SAMN05661080_05157 [Modestobacter sp. DSM 44400]|uniref:hypothetical protein n=1 Tax=Modestobacter sp. DSM 44400 TaxID=1550230 RepID=UPI00089A8797|nr:hypothetical protein [Modestobacter sp. DSM 44400]SDY96722.1 hypothetical protein SAMN05661080_05157 [Modestobacter sp. DSM 44400]